MQNRGRVIIVFTLVLILLTSAGLAAADDLISRARDEFYRENYEIAEQLWLELLEREGQNWEINFFLGMINLRKNNLDKAADYMEQAYRRADDDYYTLTNYARILYRKNEYEAAQNILDQIPADKQDFNEQYNNLSGLLALAENNPEKAEQYFKQAADLNPENYYVLNNLGLAQIRRGSYEEARDNLKKAVAQQPKEAYIYNNLGISYENLGQLEQAKENYQKALEIDPEHHRAEMNLNRVLSQINEQ